MFLCVLVCSSWGHDLEEVPSTQVNPCISISLNYSGSCGNNTEPVIKLDKLSPLHRIYINEHVYSFNKNAANLYINKLAAKVYLVVVLLLVETDVVFRFCRCCWLINCPDILAPWSAFFFFLFKSGLNKAAISTRYDSLVSPLQQHYFAR